MIFPADIRPGRVVFAVCPLLLMLTTGCRVTVLPPTSDDSVRDRNAMLQDENEALKRENKGLKVRVSEAESGLDPMAVEFSHATPRLVSMVIEGASLVEPVSGEAGPSELTLRMSPSDDRGRFLQIVGTLSVTVVGVSTGKDPILLAQDRFTPAEVREAWRGGMMGSGYVFQVPLTGRLHEDLPDSLDVVTVFETGGNDRRELRDERPVKVRRYGS